MKHTFLLDENIIYLAVKGEDDQGRTDTTCVELLQVIRYNCHSIALNSYLIGRYHQHLKKLESVRPRHVEPADFIKEFVVNPAKRVLKYEDAPPLPKGVVVPRKDKDVVRAAMLFRAVVVTTDGALREAINAQPALGLTALTPRDAIEKARES